MTRRPKLRIFVPDLLLITTLSTVQTLEIFHFVEVKDCAFSTPSVSRGLQVIYANLAMAAMLPRRSWSNSVNRFKQCGMFNAVVFDDPFG